MKAKEWAAAQQKREEFRKALVKLIHRMYPEEEEAPEAELLERSMCGPGSSTSCDSSVQITTEMIDKELGYHLTRKDLTDLQYHFYVHNGLDALNIAPMEQSWLDHVWSLIPKRLKVDNYQTALELSDEVCDEYRVAVKKAMVNFVLQDPDQIHPPNLDSGIRNDPELGLVPRPWHSRFLRNRQRLLKNLHSYNGVLAYINGIWVSVFSNLRYIDSHMLGDRKQALTHRQFRDTTKRMQDDTRGLLIRKWVNGIQHTLVAVSFAAGNAIEYW